MKEEIVINVIKKENNRKNLNEITIIRAIACLSVVLLHSIKFEVGFTYTGEGEIDFLLLTIAGLLAFGTPVFVFISELLLAYSYPEKLPKGFYKKRIKLILIPFLSMGIFYAILYNIGNLSEIPMAAFRNMLIGDYHGWFVLVIFQFYLLHHLLIKFNPNLPAKFFILIALFINLLYLGFFNFIKPSVDSGIIAYIWGSGYVKPLLGWLFYFAIAYYFGKNYELVIGYLEKFRKWLYIALFLSLAVVIYNDLYFDFGFGSKRVDMIFFTISLVLILVLKFYKVKKVPSILVTISQYSFGIYLVHYFYLEVIKKAIKVSGVSLGNINIPIYFIGSLIGSIITIYIINKIKFGKYIVGRINVRSTASKVSFPPNSRNLIS
ncbi:acyltransferase family protein [Priestia filamentosa]|uniref:acyltransferase family protein n=1 Tax=Priestia filamentosa TaxID=1402861 RepID=UPI003982C646